ncbi:MAG: ABC transporter substrate-binding subunit SaoX [Pyramidobacter sp.]|uniref:ABC transporter substrate-binding subunit SaoX n=1 Tax=Pyramidobacter sp. TaxID=1943581 RepID=UPI002A83A103|nr:ABC transporter substrate-binding subunit SaoX [Pyramidobacter sp.]MDY4031846.1 ABC transporter substrate-binding subunit SaoX [Pyramidobacter sp.]
MDKKFFCIMALTAAYGLALNPRAAAAVEKGDPVSAMVAQYTLEPLPEEDAEYTVNLGYYNCDHMTAACVGKDSGIFKALGMNVEITGNGKVPEAMSAGRMDMAYAGWTTTLRAVQIGTPLFIAAENHTGGAEYLVCSFDIKKPEDLLGKKIAVGGDPYNSMNWMEWTDQLGITNDIEQYENFSMSDADEYFSLAAGKLDAFVCCDPWGSMAEYEKTGWVMVRQNTERANGHGTCCKVCMNYNFARRHPKLASRMLLAHSLSVQYMYLHPYKAARIFAENYNVPFEVGLMTLYKKLNEEGRTISWKLNRQNMQNQLDTMKHYHVRDDINSVNLDDYIDLTYFNACGAIDFDQFIKEKVDPVFPIGMSYKEWRAKAVEVDGIVE